MSASQRTQIYMTFKMHYALDPNSLDTTSVSWGEPLCFLISFLGGSGDIP